jgi:lysophospholipase L1-like esterase
MTIITLTALLALSVAAAPDEELRGFPDASQVAAGRDDRVLVGCVGDSITAGYRASGQAATYPAVLQQLLGDGYAVTNMGEGGATMRAGADSPYWLRPGYRTLTAAKWDVLVLMLGTNDAKDRGSGGPPNWMHDCEAERPLECQFARDYATLLRLLAHLGRRGPPKIYIMIPPPLFRQGAYGMNQTAINAVLPRLVPAFMEAPSQMAPPLAGLIDVFDALGGKTLSHLTPQGCTINGTAQPAACADFCDDQSCDQCHPNDVGYALLAKTVRDALVKDV